MAIHNELELVIDHDFDPKSCRHRQNGMQSVLHCHHYATLYCQLADDAGMLDGKQLLADVCEDAFRRQLTSYYEEHGIDSVADRVEIAQQNYAACGLGQMDVRAAGPDGGKVVLEHSHVDEGWVKKWGTRDEPVNFITWGYVAAVFAAVFDLPSRSYIVEETASLVAGDEQSQFNVARM